MDQLVKAVLHCLDVSSRRAKWALELSEFDASFRPRLSIKVQVLAYFILECTILEGDKMQEEGTSS